MHLDQDTRGKWLAHAEGEVSALYPPSAQDLLGARLSGLDSTDAPGVPPLFGMTSVLEVLVYPDAWPTPLSWASLLVPLIAVGAGPLSLDRFVEIKPTSRQS
jgi:hypothetical protein